ncbi:MAG: DMT family transporter [Candidatus Zixiibacteriota bacterium]|nr:MAG: DMT family transporter [candidate division Zixibacteria bacterium]
MRQADHSLIYPQTPVVRSSPMPIWLIFGILILHQIVVACAFPFAKLGLNQINPYVFAFFRFIISSGIYLPVLFRLNRRGKISRTDHAKIFMVGLLLIPLNQVVFLVGQSLTSAGHASLLFAITPIFVYLLAIAFLREKATLLRFAGIAIALAGVYIILLGGKISFGLEYFLGDILVLVAVAAWAAATVMGKPLASKYGAFRVTGMSLVYGSLVYIPFGLFKAITADYSEVSWTGWFSIGYMAVVISVAAYVIWYWVLKYLDASRVAIMQNIQPIVATIVAAILLSEPITANLIAGGIVIIGGVILTEIR